VRHQGGTVIDDDIRYIEHSLLSDSLGKDGGLGDVEVDVEGKFSILLEDVLEFSQDLQCHIHPNLYVTIISISKRPDLRVLSENMHIGTLAEMIIQTCLFSLSS
jgi:hypothetical protein